MVKGRNEPCCLFSFAAVYFPVGPQFVYPCGGGLVAETLLHMSILLHIENFEGGKNLRFTRWRQDEKLLQMACCPARYKNALL